jgi:hypothetical protein
LKAGVLRTEDSSLFVLELTMKIETYKRGDLLITLERVGPWFAILNAMPGRKRWIERQLVCEPSGANIAYLLEHARDADWIGETEKLRDDYLRVKMDEENSRQEKKELLEDESGYEYKTIPFAHQKQAFLLSRDKKAFAIFHEQGCGKTKVVIDNASYLFEQGKIDRLIIVAKNGVHVNWIINEIPAHMPDRIGRTLAFFVAGKKKNVEPKTRPGKLHCMAFAIESFSSSEKARELLKAWLASGKCMLVVDESSTIKNYTAERTKFICEIGKMAAYRRIMTGTPITRGQENLFSQFKFLDENILGHKYFTSFRNDFCIMGGFQGRQIIGYKKTQELINIVDGHSHRVLKKDCLDLPPKIWQRQPFDMSDKQRRLYDAYRKDCIEELEAFLGKERALETAKELVITKALRLQQIACGYQPDSTGTPIEDSNVRLKTLMETVEEFGDQKVIIWARFKADLLAISKMLGQKAVSYYGGISDQDRIGAVQRFAHSERVQYIVGSSAMAYGHSLPAVGAIFHSQSSSLDTRLQSEDRCHGINRTVGPTVTYVDIEANRSIDRKIINCLRKNKELADQILKDPRSIFLEEEEAQ